MNKRQRQPLSHLKINSSSFEDVLDTPTRPITRTVGQEQSTPQTIARSTSTQELLLIALRKFLDHFQGSNLGNGS